MDSTDRDDDLQQQARNLAMLFADDWSASTAAERLSSMVTDFARKLHVIDDPPLAELRRQAHAAYLSQLLVQEDLAQRARTPEGVIPMDYESLLPGYRDAVHAARREYEQDTAVTSTVGTPLSKAIAAGDFAPYDFIEKIGFGSYCTVWKARNNTLGRLEAVKVFNRSSDVANLQALEEARKLARIRHPHVVEVLTSFLSTSGEFCFVMPLIEGTTLGQRLKQGPLSSAEAAAAVRQVALGLAAAHEQGILHRDIKPANILLHSDGRAVLADFNLAIDAAEASDAAPAGSPAYMAPEQSTGDGRIDHRADLWSLGGVVLYEALTGRRPFDDGYQSAGAIEQRILTHTPGAPHTVLPDIPEGLSRICLKCLSKNPQDRYASADELADELEPYTLAVQVKRFRGRTTDYFTGRESLLSQIWERRNSQQPLVVKGLGGTGKSLLASRYCELHERDFAHVLWVSASPATLKVELAALAAQLPGTPMTLAKSSEATIDDKIQAVIEWLDRQPDWLLVFDDAEPAELADYVPRRPRGQVLITSRIDDWQPVRGVDFLNVHEFTPEESLKFITNRLAALNLPPQEAAIHKLAKLFGGLPLALDQAAAYIWQCRIDVVDYLRLVEEHPLSKLADFPAPTGETHWSHQPADSPELAKQMAADRNRRAVATTWDLTLQRIRQESPRSVELLEISSFYAPEPIPFEVPGAPDSPLLRPLDTHGVNTSDSSPAAIRIEELLYPLRRYSMLTVDYQERTYTIHSLVQLVVRTHMECDTSSQRLTTALNCLKSSYPDVQFQPLDAPHLFSPHVLELYKYLPALTPLSEDTVALLADHIAELRLSGQRGVELDCLRALVAPGAIHVDVAPEATLRLLQLLADALIVSEDTVHAITVCHSALSHCGPEDTDWYIQFHALLGRSYSTLLDPLQADQHYAVIRSYLAREPADRGDPHDSFALYTPLIDHCNRYHRPLEGLAWVDRAQNMLARGNWTDFREPHAIRVKTWEAVLLTGTGQALKARDLLSRLDSESAAEVTPSRMANLKRGVLYGLVQVHEALEEWEAASRTWRRIHELDSTMFGAGSLKHFHSAIEHIYSLNKWDTSRAKRALNEEVLGTAHSVAEIVYGDPEIVAAILELFFGWERLDRAEWFLRRVADRSGMSIDELVEDDPHFRSAWGRLAVMNGDEPEAEKCLHRGVAEVLPSIGIAGGSAKCWIALAERSRERAGEILADGVRALSTTLGNAHRDVQMLLVRLANHHAEQANLPKQREAVVDLEKRAAQAGDPFLFVPRAVRVKAVFIEAEQGELAAIRVLERLLLDLRRRVGKWHVESLRTMCQCGDVLLRAGRVDDGIAMLGEAVQLCTEGRGSEHSLTRELRETHEKWSRVLDEVRGRRFRDKLEDSQRQHQKREEGTAGKSRGRKRKR